MGRSTDGGRRARRTPGRPGSAARSRSPRGRAPASRRGPRARAMVWDVRAPTAQFLESVVGARAEAGFLASVRSDVTSSRVSPVTGFPPSDAAPGDSGGTAPDSHRLPSNALADDHPPETPAGYPCAHRRSTSPLVETPKPAVDNIGVTRLELPTYEKLHKSLSHTTGMGRSRWMDQHDMARPPLPSPVAGVDESPLSNELLTPDDAPTSAAASSGVSSSLLNGDSSTPATGLRNRALVAVMYRSGLRPGEALALRPGDVDLEAGTVLVPPRKGGQPRLTGVDEATRQMIRVWLARRAERGIGPDRPLFCTLAGEPLKAAYVRELLPRRAKRAEIRKRVHPP